MRSIVRPATTLAQPFAARVFRSPETAFLAHLRAAFAGEAPLLLLAVFIVALAERGPLAAPAPDDTPSTLRFGLWAVMFELISAFGTVGLSLGYPTDGLSRSSHFTPLSKFVMMLTMIAGRHRGLPSAIDTDVRIDAAHTLRRSAPSLTEAVAGPTTTTADAVAIG